MELSNGALIHYVTQQPFESDTTITLARPGLLKFLATGSLDGISVSGDSGTLMRLLALTDSPDPDFAIVTP